MGKARIAAAAGQHLYAIGLGSNRALSRKLSSRAIVEAASAALGKPPLTLLARSPIIASRPIGPSMRTYANAAALIAAPLEPLAMLDHLHAIERRFGRRRFRRWGARTLDLDLLIWSGGRVRSRRLTVPHPALPARAFVLDPLRSIARGWCDPRTSRTIAQLTARLAKPKPVDRTSRAL